MKSYIRSERQEAAKEAEWDKARKTAGCLIKLGQMSLADIAEVTELPLEIVKELEDEIMKIG